MTIDELVNKLHLLVKIQVYKPTDKNKYRERDKGGNLFYDVDYFISHKDESDILILC